MGFLSPQVFWFHGMLWDQQPAVPMEQSAVHSDRDDSYEKVKTIPELELC